MDEARRVRGGDSAGRLAQHTQQLHGRVWCREPLPKIEPIDEGHRHEDLAVVLAHIVDGDDIGVRQPGERLGLASQPLRLGTSTQHLDRDISIELGVMCDVDDPHPSRAESALDPIAIDLGGNARCGSAAPWALDVRGRLREITREKRVERSVTALAARRVVGDRSASSGLATG